MPHRYQDPDERDARDRRNLYARESSEAHHSLDLRYSRDEVASRDQIDSRNQHRLQERDPDRHDPDVTGSGLQRERDSASRRAYSCDDDQRYHDHSDPPSTGYMDHRRDIYRQPLDPRSARREEELSSRYQEYFLPAEGISREVIQYDICRYLGDDALVRPYVHPDGRSGYIIKACRVPTSTMITTMKQDSKSFEVEQAQRHRQGRQQRTYSASSAIFDDRQRQGRPDVSQSRYLGHDMDISMEGSDPREDPRYRYQDPGMDRMDPRLDRMDPRTYRMDPRLDRMDPRLDRMDPRTDRMDPRTDRMDPRMDRMDMRHMGQYSRQPLQINRHELPVSQAYLQEPAPPSAYQIPPISSGHNDLASSQPRTLGANNTPPPPIGRSSEAISPGFYPATTSASHPVATPPVPYQAGARQPGWGDTPNFQTDTAR